MNRRTFNQLAGLAAAGISVPGIASGQEAAESGPGRGTPAHDADLLMPVTSEKIVLENAEVLVSFDGRTGALVQFVSKKTGWNVQKDPALAESFQLIAPTTDRSWNPVLGARNRVKSMQKSGDGQSIVFVWADLESEFSGRLNITLTGTVTLQGSVVNFDMALQNRSQQQVASVAWPIIGSLGVPASSSTLRRFNTSFTLGREVSVYPRFANEPGYSGVNWPTQIGEGRYNLFLADKEGLYVGTHDRSQSEITRYFLELKPGYSDSRSILVPEAKEIDGHPVRITASVQHFPFASPGETVTLSRIALSPFQGNWHAGADVYRKWFTGWFKRPPQPSWIDDPHVWQSLQFHSAEDSQRTLYRNLPRRLQSAAKAGVKAVQLIGWNNGGQDRNNPSHDTDPRLGTFQEFKDAIKRIEAMGIRVVLFNKYTWSDISTERYRKELHRSDALDPNGVPYYFRGYRYDTPEQLADINTRRFTAACQNDPRWVALCRAEFQKSLDLGASGILYDEVEHHGGADYCFSREHGHRSPVTTWSGDTRLGQTFREQARVSRGEYGFLLAGEGLYDLEKQFYSLTYTRVNDVHVPLMRYNDPFAAIMIAVTGFDDREMVNTALQYRYIMSLEPFNFKGDVDDYPLTVAYAMKMENLRRRYRAYVWDAEFRDNQDAAVTLNGKRYERFSTFRRTDGKRAAVVVNPTRQAATLRVQFAGDAPLPLSWASVDDPSLHPAAAEVSLGPRSAVIVMEQ